MFLENLNIWQINNNNLIYKVYNALGIIIIILETFELLLAVDISAPPYDLLVYWRPRCSSE